MKSCHSIYAFPSTPTQEKQTQRQSQLIGDCIFMWTDSFPTKIYLFPNKMQCEWSSSPALALLPNPFLKQQGSFCLLVWGNSSHQESSDLSAEGWLLPYVVPLWHLSSAGRRFIYHLQNLSRNYRGGSWKRWCLATGCTWKKQGERMWLLHSRECFPRQWELWLHHGYWSPLEFHSLTPPPPLQGMERRPGDKFEGWDKDRMVRNKDNTHTTFLPSFFCPETASLLRSSPSSAALMVNEAVVSPDSSSLLLLPPFCPAPVWIPPSPCQASPFLWPPHPYSFFSAQFSWRWVTAAGRRNVSLGRKPHRSISFLSQHVPVSTKYRLISKWGWFFFSLLSYEQMITKYLSLLFSYFQLKLEFWCWSLREWLHTLILPLTAATQDWDIWLLL